MSDPDQTAAETAELAPLAAPAAAEPAAPISPAEPAAPVLAEPTEALAAAAPVSPAPPLVEALEPEALRQVLESNAQRGDAPAEPPVPTTSELPPRELRGVLEALLLVAKAPLSAERLAALLPGTDAGYIAGFLAGLAERYGHEGRGWDLKPIAGGWQLLTRAEFHPWVRQLDRKELPSTLSRSAVETLAVIAYKQPVSRGQIEDIRGVQCGPMIRQLMDLKLVQVLGRSEELLGKPLLYGTTDRFLDRFGIGSPEELPRRHELA
jgi:segregation and condensation protein B